MSIGHKIKTLRRAKELTQEELAEVLGVSSKAISQWECNRTAPDISQLPMLCHFFEVTADELLEIDVFHKMQERDKIIAKNRELAHNGRNKEALQIIKEGLKRFPNDALLMSFLIDDSTVYICKHSNCEQANEQIEECRNYSEYILEHSVEDVARYSAIYFMSLYHFRKGEEDKAWEYAMKLPILCDGQEFLRVYLHTGTEQVWAEQNLRLQLLDFFALRMLENWELDSGEKLYSEDELMELRDKKYALFSLLFEKGDYGCFSDHLANSHERQAREYAKRKNKEKCLYHLEQAAKHALDFISYMKSESFVHTSLLWKNYSCPSDDVSLHEEENIAALTLSRIELPEYDFLRKEEAFSKLVKCLSDCAGCNDY